MLTFEKSMLNPAMYSIGRSTRGLFAKINLGDGNINGKLDPTYFLNNKDHPS